MLSAQSMPPGERDLYSKLRQVLTHPGLLRGNLVEMRRRCGKKNCACWKDSAARHRSLYLGISLNGKRRMIYIPPDWEEQVREWVERYSQVREVLEKLSLACIKRLEKREM